MRGGRRVRVIALGRSERRREMGLVRGAKGWFGFSVIAFVYAWDMCVICLVVESTVVYYLLHTVRRMHTLTSSLWSHFPAPSCAHLTFDSLDKSTQTKHF